MSEAPTINMADFDPKDLALEDIDIAQRSLWIEDKKMAFFDRLRDEDPVHYCKDSEFGPYWSVTRYKDIMEVDGNWHIFHQSQPLRLLNQKKTFRYLCLSPWIRRYTTTSVKRFKAQLLRQISS